MSQCELALQSRGPLKDPFMNEYSRDQELPSFNFTGPLGPLGNQSSCIRWHVSLSCSDNFHHHWPRLSLAHEAQPQNSPTELGSALSTVIAESSQVDGLCPIYGDSRVISSGTRPVFPPRDFRPNLLGCLKVFFFFFFFMKLPPDSNKS